MKRIGLLSDTHSYWDERYEKYFADVDEIWHAGDIGSTELAERFQAFKPFRAVCGNCDGGDLRRMFPDLLRFKCEDADIMIKHIGGYPGNYDRSIVGRMYTTVRPTSLSLDIATFSKSSTTKHSAAYISIPVRQACKDGKRCVHSSASLLTEKNLRT